MFLRKATSLLTCRAAGRSHSCRIRRGQRAGPAAEFCRLQALEPRVLLSGNSPVAIDDAYEVATGGTISLESSGETTSEIESLDVLDVNTSTAEKPQSKVWQYDGEWWSVFSDGSDTWVWRLDGSDWVEALMVSSRKNTQADVKVDGDLVHIVMVDGTKTQLRSIQYAPGSANGYELWSQQPEIVKPGNIPDIETATIDIDSTGRMWLAYAHDDEVIVRYSDAPYDSWSGDIVLEDDIKRDDIAVVTALPDGSIGVMWSNQEDERFGFRRHIDGTDPESWLQDEVPASQSARNKGGGMADDHLNLAVAQDGTLYAAVKTSYGRSGYPKLAFLVRRPDGTWDDLYEISETGTRPIVQRNDATGELLFIYTPNTSGGGIVYRELTDNGVSVVVGPERVLFDGDGEINPTSLNDASGAKDGFTDELIVIGAGKNGLAGARVVVTLPVADVGVLVNDTDDEDDLLTAILVDGPQHGQLTLNPNGTFFYQHDGGSSEFDSFTYRAFDGTGQSNAATVDITVTTSDTVTAAFQQGVTDGGSYDGAADSYIRGDDPDRNKGSSSTLKVDGSPDMAALFRWELGASIPAGQTVTAASLRLYVSNDTDATFDLYELLAPWVEDEVTFDEFADGSSWETPGAQGGTDRGSTVLGSVGEADTGFVTIDLNAAGIAVVQSWIDDPSSNHGLAILNYDDDATDQVRFNSSDDGDDNTRPLLSITYSSGAPEPNEAPEVTATGGAAGYTENAAAVVVDDGILVSDADDADLTGATVAITGGFAAGEDMLAFADQNGINGSYDAGSGVLTLSGTASVADYQAALRSVTYANSSDDPSTALRTVVFTVDDGTDGGSDQRAVNVAAVNDAPVATATVSALSYVENDPPTAVDDALTVSDVDDIQLDGASAAITGGFVSGEDVLAFTDQNGINGNYSAGTGVLTLSGTASAADYQTALRSVTYENTSGSPSLLSRTVTFTVDDGDDAGQAQRTIDIAEFNESPTVTTTVSALAYTENDPPVLVDAGVSVSDADSSELTGAAVEIASGFQAGADLLGFTDQNGINGSYDAGTGVLALSGTASVADYQAALRSVTYENTSEAPATDARTMTFTVNDGIGHGSGERTIDVTAVNDVSAVTATAQALAYSENDPPIAVDESLMVTDLDSSELVGATVAITTGFASGQDLLAFVNQSGISGGYDAGTGVLTLSGTASVADYEAALRSVTYANSSEDPATALRTVSFTVDDGTGTADDSRSVSVTAVNDAPTTTGIGNVTVEIDAADTEIDLLPAFADAEQPSADLTFAVTGNTNPSLVTTAIDAGTDTLTLSYAAGQSGSAEITLRAIDAGSEFVEATFTVSVSSGADPETAAFQQGVNGYSGGSDTWTRGSDPDEINGGSSELRLRGRPDIASFLRWDVSSILPPGQAVVSASITLNVTMDSSESFDLFQMLVPWVESETTYNEFASGSSWETPGAQGASDRDSTVLGTLAAPGSGTVTIDLNAAGIAVVQSWIDDPAANHGIAILNYDDDVRDQVRFSSNDASDAGERPILSVTYIPGSGQNLLAGSGEFEGTSAGELRESDLTPLVDEAAARLIAAASPEERAAVQGALENIVVEITDLPGAALGLAGDGMIQIDVDAAGLGWFIDSTPRDDAEFGADGRAETDSAAAGRYDLLSVIAHELAHVLGHEHTDGGLMNTTLASGTRTILDAGTDHSAHDGEMATGELELYDAFFRDVGVPHETSSLLAFL